MIFTKETHAPIFDGYIIIDCAIRSNIRQTYLLIEDNDEKVRDGDLREVRIIFIFAEQEDPNRRSYGVQFNNLMQPKLAYFEEYTESILIDLSGNSYSRRGVEESVDSLPRKREGSQLQSAYLDIKTIGESIYAIGTPHVLYKRNDIDDWQLLSKSIPLTDEYLGKYDSSASEPGWDAFDGFSEQDMYLAGEDGALWNYNGQNFKQLDFPSKENLENVCCAGDGYVYLGGRRGRLWRGKDDTWELISEEEFSVNWKDIVWFNDRLFLGSDYGLWEFKDGEVIRAEVPDQVLTCSGALSICPEKKYLLTAGNNGASMYDGKEWTVLFDRFDLPD